MTYFGDSAPRVSATVITLAVIAYVVFGLRVHTRLRNRAWGMDDWCMAAAIVSELLYVGYSIKLADRIDPFLCIGNIMSRRFFQGNWSPRVPVDYSRKDRGPQGM